MVQPQVQLMSINFKFEVPILWLFQVQIITNIIYSWSIRVVYYGNVKHIFTVCHSRQINVATWFLVLPIDIENKSTIESINIYIALYIEFLSSYFRNPSRWKQWYIEIYRVGDNRTVNTSASPHISGQVGTNNPC